MRKQNELADPQSCLNKAAIDEPLFVLRASDPIAPMVVYIWASLNVQLGVHGQQKSVGAWACAVKMEDWREQKYGAVKYKFKPKANPTL